ncbi:MAG: MarR family transcriptional regulator [Dehalococcoidia bacterium]|nr:MarR family transcriptional regulator [Dehalococcoidia bacterium]
MDTENRHLDRVIEAMVRTPPIIHRKLNQNILKVALEQVGGDIALHHLMIMRLLQTEGSLHSSEIGETIAISKAQMTHSINKLVSLDLVQSQPDTVDRRKVNIRLTSKGQKTMEKLDEIIKNRIAARLSALGDEELEKLAQSYEFIAKTFSDLQ